MSATNRRRLGRKRNAQEYQTGSAPLEVASVSATEIKTSSLLVSNIPLTLLAEDIKSSWTGAIETSATFKFRRVGDIVTLQISGFTGTTDGTSDYLQANIVIPAGFKLETDETILPVLVCEGNIFGVRSCKFYIADNLITIRKIEFSNFVAGTLILKQTAFTWLAAN